MPPKKLTSIEVCAGAGGQAVGLEMAGFRHLACVEIDRDACQTIQMNRPRWLVEQTDVRDWSWDGSAPVDLLAGGVPCPPFSVAGQQLGEDDERDLFPEMLRLVDEIRPGAVMIENVKGLLTARFAPYREQILAELDSMGYSGEWKLLQAADFGVPQLRPRSILVALPHADFTTFAWPSPLPTQTSVGDALLPIMEREGWPGAQEWASRADGVAPTLVGGSRKHGGADLGPTRAKAEWLRRFGVDARGLADAPPAKGHTGLPRLTVEMAAILQGFPHDWQFSGRKTSAYRQVGNAFPPPVAAAVGRQIAKALRARRP
mgnify:CR=1 FL=1